MTRRWPLILLALPAGVATWSGWVGLGELTGFGPVKPLPGIIDSFTINTAVTLPIGVEAYAGYAMGAWLSQAARISGGTRNFARWSAIGALLLGMVGQVAYHLLIAAHETAVQAHKVLPDAKAAAPWLITTLVSCLPVAVLGLAAALSHMLHRDAQAAPVDLVAEPVERVEVVEVAAVEPVAEAPKAVDPGDDDAPGYVPEPLSEELATQAASRFLSDVVTGEVPGVRRIKNELNIGQEKAQQVRAYLATLTNA